MATNFQFEDSEEDLETFLAAVKNDAEEESGRRELVNPNILIRNPDLRWPDLDAIAEEWRRKRDEPSSGSPRAVNPRVREPAPRRFATPGSGLGRGRRARERSLELNPLRNHDSALKPETRTRFEDFADAKEEEMKVNEVSRFGDVVEGQRSSGLNEKRKAEKVPLDEKMTDNFLDLSLD